MADAGHEALPLSAQIRDLSERIAACERQLGDCSQSPAPTSPSRAKGSPSSVTAVTLHARVAELNRKLEEIFKSSKSSPKFQELEQGLDQLEDWLQAQHAGAAQILLHASTKKNYVVQHAQQLQEFAKELKEVEALESYVNTPSLRELPAYGDRLRKVDANSAVMVGSAAALHDQVGRLAEDYYAAMTSLNDQLLSWDRLLQEKIGTGV